MSTITVDTSTDLQTMRGWEATAEAGHQWELPADTESYPSTSFANYKTDLLDAALDLGINAIRIEWRLDDINASGFSIGSPHPNAIQPSTATAGQIFYDRFEQAWDAWVSDYADMLAAQGETLWITFCVVDFRSGGYDAEDTPSEYSAAVTGAVVAFHNYTGRWPDVIEPILEPDNSGGNPGWTAAKTANNIVQANTDLIAAGMPSTVKWITPSVTSAANGTTWIADMKTANASVTALTSIYAYHRYGGTNTDVGNIWTVANSDGKETAMNEWISASHFTLYDDITVGHISLWQQFTLAFPYGGWSDTGAEYFEINTSTWAVILNPRTKYLRHYFKYVRRGAVRKGVSNVGGAGLGVPFRNPNGTYVVVVKYTGSDSTVISGLPPGTYAIRYTTGDGVSAPSAFDQTIANQTITAGQDVSFSMPGSGIATVYDVNFMSQYIPTSKRGAKMLILGS